MGYLSVRFLFVLTVIWGASIFWIAPRPPMVDLPQHAGQVAILYDLLTGTSPWANVFRLNLFTPYLLGYGVAFGLSFFMPVAMTLKVTLSLAYLAFVFALVKLRQRFNADPQLDWFFLLSFFGPAYAWGFLTFLTAAPVAIFFILLAVRYLEEPGLPLGVATALLGLALLLSHGLMFVFGLAVAGGIYLLRRWPGRATAGRWLLQSWPLMLPAFACLAYFLISQKLENQYGGIGNVGPPLWRIEWLRVMKIFVNSLGGRSTILVGASAIILPLIPWMLGLRIDFKRPATWLMFAVSFLIAVAAPFFAMATGILYLRFALFTLPAYALMFTLSSAPARTDRANGTQSVGRNQRALQKLAVPLMLVLTWLILGTHTAQAWRFARESRDFEPVLAAMQPGQRALSLPLDRSSKAAENPYAYLHFGNWYQSEKQGLVDFNFAWFPPQIARFKPDHVPAVRFGFEFDPDKFDWQKHQGERYRYFVVRHRDPVPEKLFDGARCPPSKLLESGAWTLFERRNCSVAFLVRPVGTN